MTMKYFPEQSIRKIFSISLWLKGVHALLEIVGGATLLFISQATIDQFVSYLTQGELTEDPGSVIASYIAHASMQLTVSAQVFAAWYLLVHGVIKGALIVGLLKNKMWMYPIAIIVFAVFALYQVERFIHTHSPLMAFLTILDLIVILLTWHEYNQRMHLLKRGEFL